MLCLSSIAVGLSLSKPLTALGLFGLLLVWLIDGNIVAKLTAFYNNKIALLISSIYILTILGLIYTSNFDFALDDVRRKMPLFFLPFYLSGFQPLTKKELHFLLKLFVSGVLIASFWSFFVYLGGLNIHITDKRDLSRFNSHIRFGLEIALALFFSIYYIKKSKTIGPKLFWLSITLWLLFSLYLFNLFSGIVVFLAASVVLIFIFGLFAQKRKRKIIFLASFLLLVAGGFIFINNSINNFYNDTQVESIKELPFTENGNKYQIDSYTEASTLKENGHYIERNIVWNELPNAWNDRSNIPFEGKDLKGQKLTNTLIRFITSKGLRKNKETVENLTKDEINAIENGVSNHKYLKMNNFSIRIHKIIWEYDAYLNGQDFNGHSMLMRWEYWKTAAHIIKSNPFMGVGTGDLQDSFDAQYEIDLSKLTPQYRLRTHNQYLTYAVTFGVFGLLWFLICLIYPIIKTKLYKNYFYLSFFSIVVFSMIAEDTLETQIGINFFVFFNTIFLLS